MKRRQCQAIPSSLRTYSYGLRGKQDGLVKMIPSVRCLHPIEFVPKNVPVADNAIRS